MSITRKKYQPFREMAIKTGVVKEVLEKRETLTVVLLEVDGKLSEAISYDFFTGELKPGDRVKVNTSAIDLNLGTGGKHYIIANLDSLEDKKILKPGHIIKLRYTPMQFKTNCLEEVYPQVINKYDKLDNLPVVVLELHSMVLPVAVAIKRRYPHCSLVYIMTDGGSLPLALSKQIFFLQEGKYLNYTISAGHAFGGDLEAVNVYTALLGAKYILQADAVIIAMGPGNVGTATRFGFTGIEQGENINKVNALGGKAITCLRLSFADSRSRHHVISHHSITSLKKIAVTPACIALPLLKESEEKMLLEQLQKNGLPGIHNAKWHNVAATMLELQQLPFKVQSMGRTPQDDPVFFASAVAAGEEVGSELVSK